METNRDTSVNVDLNGELHTTKSNPLFIPEITDHMFQFLNLSDIKNCRSVCQKWNELVEQFLKKLSVVKFSKPERVEEFNEVFRNAQQSQIFTSFRFGEDPLSRFDKKWPVNSFVAFIEKWNHNLSEIALTGPKFMFDIDNGTYDLSPILPSTLVKLEINISYPRMIISIDKIRNIRILELYRCILNLTPGTTLNNVEIVLKDVTFRVDEENVEELLINPLLNFDVLKKASLYGGNIALDLQGSHSLDQLCFGGTSTINWETSNWEIRKLYPGGYTCEKLESTLLKSHIKYKELGIRLNKLNVSLLSEGIETLQVELVNDEEIPPRIYGQHNFPHLKHLRLILKKGNDFAPFVEFFKNCPKLGNLSVASNSFFSSNGENILKTSSVPPSVKTLRLMYGVPLVLDQSLQLESLSLLDKIYGVQNSNIVELAKELHIKNLAWFEVDGASSSGGHRDIFDNEKGNIVKSLMDLNLDNFVVGFFDQVNNSEFEKSYLFPLVDTQGKFYLFQRGEKGKAISERDAEIYHDAEENAFK